MSEWLAVEETLVTLLARSARGPKREGLYALWLTLRVARDRFLDPPHSERAHRRRLAALEQRLSSLTVPAPTRRALASALAHLRDADPPGTAAILRQLIAPARDSLGVEAGEVVAEAARAAALPARTG